MDADDKLILACTRDPSAFRALVECFKMRIYSFIIHLAGREAADDLFQEVWLKVFKSAGRYEARGKAASWLFKIANNVCLDHLRKRGREKLDGLGEAAEALPSKAVGPSAEAEHGEARRRIHQAIESLPVEQRQVFLMREFGGMAFKEVAAALDVPLGTALSRMNAALGKLRTALEDIGA